MYIDLTHTLQNSISTYPGASSPCIKAKKTLQKDGCAVTQIHLQSHHGTHMDAPSHFIKGLKSVDQLDIPTFIGSGIVLRLQEGKQINTKQIPEGTEWVLLCTGWSKYWKTEQYQKPFPSISENVAKELVKRKIKGVGIDSLSVDNIKSETFPIHHIILGQNMVIIQNLTNLEPLIGKKFEFTCLPLKIIDCDGSPVRAIAKITDE